MEILLLILLAIVALVLVGISATVYESRRNAVHHKHRGGRDE